MTPDERALNLRAELAASGVAANNIAMTLLERRDPLTGSIDRDCMEAVETILAFRDHARALRQLVKNAEDENERLREACKVALAQVEEIKGQVQILRDMLPEEVTDV
jgi:phage shock protein A